MTDTTTAAAERPSGGWLIALGILMIVLGIVGLGMAYWLTIAAVIWFGILAIIAGVAQLIDVIHHRGWKAIVWQVLIGLVYVIAGVFMVLLPVNAAFVLTIVIAASLVAAGILRLVLAFTARGAGAGAKVWLVISAIVSVVLGVLLWGTVTPPGAEALATPEGQLAWLRSWGWVIGLFVAIELIAQGIAMLTLGLAVRSETEDTTGPAGAATA